MTSPAKSITPITRCFVAVRHSDGTLSIADILQINFGASEAWAHFRTWKVAGELFALQSGYMVDGEEVWPFLVPALAAFAPVARAMR